MQRHAVDCGSLNSPKQRGLLARSSLLVTLSVLTVLASPTSAADKESDTQTFWSFRPLQSQVLPTVTDRSWPRRRLDYFILARLEAQGLTPSAPTDARTLMRRASFDLLGLPAVDRAVGRFASDRSPDAYERLLDRLLGSPQHGERWARHWLDLARYTDRTASWLELAPNAYLYRDWVTSALNADVPYDDFVRRQLATDLLPETAPDDLPALGFIGLSPTYWKELQLAPDVIKTVVAEEWEERIDTLGRTFLGLTIACARCHDHKFDPISQRDYYALAGVFASVRLADRLLLPEEAARAVLAARAQVKKLEGRIAELDKKNKEEADATVTQEIANLRESIATLQAKTPNYNAPSANAIVESSLHVLPDGPHRTKLEYRDDKPRDLAVQLGGNPSTLGETVPRRFLAALSRRRNTAPVPFRPDGSGRLDLAEALIDDAGPLAARVIVNRVWRHHFGEGLVDTPSNFGENGSRPSHPALIDDLAARFVRAGWSLKWLHREILLSATYRQSSGFDAKKGTVDPDSRTLWRYPRRRLEAEAWRDALLAVTGELNVRIGGPPEDLGADRNHRRTLYGTVQRRDVNVMLRLHDFPDPVGHSPKRDSTTTPLKQLFALNSPFMRNRARALVSRLEAFGLTERDDRVRQIYEWLFQRRADASEIDLARDFLGEDSSLDTWLDYAQTLLVSNAFLFVD